MRSIVTRTRLLVVTAMLLLSMIPGPAVAQDSSLYERLGGQEAIQAVVGQFVSNVGGDSRINGFFANTDLDRLQALLVEQICQATGGPCVYTGRSMTDTHRAMGITGADFNALVEDLIAALDSFSVPDQEKGELLAILGPLQTDIVDSSLYARLGGRGAIEAVVGQFVSNVGGDSRINGFFANTDLARLQTLLVEQICQATGGPCVYTGRSMADTHRGMGITGADFSALVEDLVAALDSFNVPAQEKGELLAILGPLQSDIVQPRPSVTPSQPSQSLPSPATPTLTSTPTLVVPTAQPGATPAATSRPAGTSNVEIRNFAFNPATTTISVGSTVVWRNFDQAGHTATGQGFDTGVLNNGQSGQATFTTAGTFNYMCTIHPSIRGTIVVQ